MSTHGEGSVYPELTLTHFHSDACCGLVNGKPELICGNKPYNACTTCVATGKSSREMALCVASRTRSKKNLCNKPLCSGETVTVAEPNREG